MALFHKIFPKKTQPIIPELAKSSEMLNEDLYWQIIDKSLKNTSDQNSQEQYLVNEIEKINAGRNDRFSIKN